MIVLLGALWGAITGLWLGEDAAAGRRIGAEFDASARREAQRELEIAARKAAAQREFDDMLASIKARRLASLE